MGKSVCGDVLCRSGYNQLIIEPKSVISVVMIMTFIFDIVCKVYAHLISFFTENSNKSSYIYYIYRTNNNKYG